MAHGPLDEAEVGASCPGEASEGSAEVVGRHVDQSRSRNGGVPMDAPPEVPDAIDTSSRRREDEGVRLVAVASGTQVIDEQRR